MTSKVQGSVFERKKKVARMAEDQDIFKVDKEKIEINELPE